MGSIRKFLRRQVPLWLLIILLIVIGIGVTVALTVYTLTYYAKAATAVVTDDTLIRIDAGVLYIATSNKPSVTTAELDDPYSEVNNAITSGRYVMTFYFRENTEVWAGRSWKLYVYFGGNNLGEFTITQNTAKSGSNEGVTVHIDLGLTPGQEAQLPESGNPVRIIATRQ